MRRYLVSAIALALAGASVTGMAATPAAAQAELATTQLPRAVRPSHYEVAVTPHADKLSFDGKVTVTVDVLKPTASITLNAIDMTFSSVRLAPADGKAALAAPKVSVDARAQTATFTFGKPIAPGTYKLSMDYTGRIGTQANGLFAIDYDTKDGKKRALYTQFENSDARRFIPSWDEPAYKATFDLSATVPAGEMAVSNMPVASTTALGNGLSKITFQTSPKMSTYLLFFGLGDFDRATAKADGTEIGVITQKGKSDQAAFALESSSAVLKEYNDYFGVPYPLPKLDNIASPGSSQFFSAMENWGAIYTFEYALLLDPSISTQRDRENVFGVAAHEMAHQWFGDLVTMRWWDDLWLNEGFASWMAARTTEKLHPEWNTSLDAVGTREGAMSRDAVATTHPVVQHVETVEQASQAFDAITYSKGEAVINMLEAYVGPDAWRQGVRNYIKAHAYGNTVSDDLWKAMDGVAGGKPITQVAHDFTLQPGVPLIKVDAAACSNGTTTIKLTQGEFTKDRPGKKPLRWHVPVNAQVVGHAVASTLVDGQATMKLEGCGPVLVNAGQSGYYRTLYAPAQFAALKGVFHGLAPIDQLGVMGDTWSQGMAGLQPVSDILDLARDTPADAAPEIWAEVAGNFGALDNYYRGDKARQERFRAFAVKQLKPVFARLGWEAKKDERTSTTLLRTELIGTLAELGDKDMLAEVRRRYDAQATDPKAVPAELRKTIMSIVAVHADAATWDKLHEQAKAEKTPLIKDRLYGMLGLAEDESLAKRALELALTDEPGATNSAGMIGTVGYRHPELAYDFAMAHRAQVDKLVDSTSSSRYYPALGSSSSQPSMIDKIKAYEQTIAPTSRRAAETVIANIKYRMMVREKRLPAVDAWLQKHGG
ncbi:aminopeptidase [Frateuria sp. Soil773]|uniref:M1 family metallopeptidase n=1 Tax=Frateuria sp. Soil773 TaxID=1736407 RepID=UPI0006F695E3|nr:M1 family metallopeptidase [Frateuria sp. Soil773]KRE89675.1 aminopeptidase [Frateuria sp. Soil773]